MALRFDSISSSRRSTVRSVGPAAARDSGVVGEGRAVTADCTGDVVDSRGRGGETEPNVAAPRGDTARCTLAWYGDVMLAADRTEYAPTGDAGGKDDLDAALVGCGGERNDGDVGGRLPLEDGGELILRYML